MLVSILTQYWSCQCCLSASSLCFLQFHQTADLFSSPLLCFVLFAADTWLSGAKADTHARWLSVIQRPTTEEKRSIVWSYFTAVNGNIAKCSVWRKAIHHCDNTTSLYKCMKSHFYSTSKKHRYQLTGPVFNWYQNNPTFSQNLTPLVWSASKPQILPIYLNKILHLIMKEQKGEAGA